MQTILHGVGRKLLLGMLASGALGCAAQKPKPEMQQKSAALSGSEQDSTYAASSASDWDRASSHDPSQPRAPAAAAPAEKWDGREFPQARSQPNPATDIHDPKRPAPNVDLGMATVSSKPSRPEEVAVPASDDAPAATAKSAASARGGKAGAESTPAGERAQASREADPSAGAEGRQSAEDQERNAQDRKITKRIRESLVSQSGLSFTAKNVQVITTAGLVTLRGAVRSSKERVAVERVARKVAGDTRVHNELEVTINEREEPSR